MADIALVSLEIKTEGLERGVRRSEQELEKLKRELTETERASSKFKDVLDKMGSGSIGNFFGRISPSFSAFRREMGLANTALKGFGDNLSTLPGPLGQMGSGLSSVTSLLGGFGGAAAAAGVGLAAVGAGLAASAKATADYAREVQNAARITGLSNSAIQSLGREAQGVGQNFTDVIDVVNQFATQVADARGGSKELGAIFKSLGVNVNDFGLSTEKALDKALEALNRLPPSIQKTSIASRLFGEEGSRLILSLRDTGQGIDSLNAKWKQMGAILDNPTIKEAERFNSTLRQTEIRLEALRNRIGGSVLPIFNDWLDQLGAVEKGLRNIPQIFTGGAPVPFTPDERAAAESLFGIRIPLGRTTVDPSTTTPSRGTFASTTTKPTGPTGGRSRTSIPEIPDLSRTFDFLPPVLRDIRAAADTAGRSWEDLNKSLFESNRALGPLEAQLAILGPAALKAGGEFLLLKEQLSGKVLTPIDAARLDAARQKADQLSGALDSTHQQFDETTARIKALKDALLALNTVDRLRRVAPPSELGGIETKIDLGSLLRAAPLIVPDNTAIAAGQRETQERILEAVIRNSRPTLREEIFGSTEIDILGNKRRSRGAADDSMEEFFRGLASGRQGLRETAANLAEDFGFFFADYFARKANEVLRNSLDSLFGPLLDRVFGGATGGGLFRTPGINPNAKEDFAGDLLKLSQGKDPSKGALDNFFGRISDGFSKVTGKAGDFFGKLFDGFSSVIGNLGGLFQQALGGLGGIFGSLGGSLGGVFGGIGGFFKDIFGSIASVFGGFFADGGSVFGNRPIVVGERGPELFLPRSNGYIVSNRDLMGFMRSIEPRAFGGSVFADRPYLVGEYGPEMYVPRDYQMQRAFVVAQASAQAPASEPRQQPPIVIQMHVHGVQDANSFRKSQGQIAFELERQIDRGRKMRGAR